MQKKELIKRINLWLPVFLWALLIFKLSSNSLPQVTGTYWGDFVFKKSSHILFYGMLSALFYRALIGEGVDKFKSAYLCVILAVFYGITDEFHQSLVPGREARVRDIFIDGLGASIVSFFLFKVLPKMPKEVTIAFSKLGLI